MKTNHGCQERKNSVQYMVLDEMFFLNINYKNVFSLAKNKKKLLKNYDMPYTYDLRSPRLAFSYLSSIV